jgi:inositol oxygenase
MMHVGRELFDRDAIDIHHRHRSQTLNDVAALNEKYKSPALGKVMVSEVVAKLSLVTDPTDKKLYETTQWGHCAQVIHMMEEEGVVSEEFLVSGLVHDIGKILLHTGEDPANVVCDNFPVGEYDEGIGLDNVVFQWNHDEFGYMRLKDHMPVYLAKLIRYHSLNPTTLKYLSQEDMWLYENYLRPFRRYDKLSKSDSVVPNIDVEKYMKLLDKWFPNPIII